MKVLAAGDPGSPGGWGLICIGVFILIGIGIWLFNRKR